MECNFEQSEQKSRHNPLLLRPRRPVGRLLNVFPVKRESSPHTSAVGSVDWRSIWTSSITGKLDVYHKMHYASLISFYFIFVFIVTFSRTIASEAFDREILIGSGSPSKVAKVRIIYINNSQGKILNLETNTIRHH